MMYLSTVKATLGNDEFIIVTDEADKLTIASLTDHLAVHLGVKDGTFKADFVTTSIFIVMNNAGNQLFPFMAITTFSPGLHHKTDRPQTFPVHSIVNCALLQWLGLNEESITGIVEMLAPTLHSRVSFRPPEGKHGISFHGNSQSDFQWDN